MADTLHDKIGPAAPTQPQVDLREAPRHCCPDRHELRVAVRPTFLPMTVLVKDISTKGIGLLVESHIAPGACLAIPWMYGPPERWRTVRATVVRLAPRRDGGWVAGCVFVERLEPRDIEAFLKHERRPFAASHHQ
jgi:hypothetical protein